MTTEDRRSKIRRGWMMATAAAALGLAGAAHAADPVTLTLVDRDTGRPLTVWHHDGRVFVAGQPGAGYCLRVTNNTGGRIEAVLSVDGVNIYTGQTASYGQDGYVVDPYESYDQCGWRKSLKTVAAFSFTALPNSYAARTGRPADVGVVGMAVFYERPDYPPPPPPVIMPRDVPLPPAPASPPGETTLNLRNLGSNRTPLSAAAPPPPPRSAPPPVSTDAPPPPPAQFASPPALAERTEKLGTAHGALETSVVHLVSFHRLTPTPAFTRQVEYDSRANLVAAGVIPASPRPPRAFPGNQGFVPDPPPLR